MPDTISLVVSTSMPYRGTTETFTNKYHLTGAAPSNTAAWDTLATAVWNLQRNCIGTAANLVGFQGYAAGNNAAVYMKTAAQFSPALSGPSVGAGTAGYPPGDAAVWVRWATGARNSKNKPIYLRKYIHCVPQADSVGDTPTAVARTGLLALGTGMMNGTLPDGRTICAPQGALPTASGVSQFFTTRTLKRTSRSPT